MKKFAPVLITLGIIIIGIAAFSLMRGTAEAPVEEGNATTTESATSSASTDSPIGIGGANTTIKNVIKAYANPAWDIRLRYDPEWKLSQTGELVTISSVSANFMVSKGQMIAKPARLESTMTTRVVLGTEVEVTRFKNPNEEYAYYEYFTVRANGENYYFKVSSIIDPNPKVEEFVKNIVAQ